MEEIVEDLKREPKFLLKQDMSLRNKSDRALYFEGNAFPFKDQPTPKCHIASIASGNAVRSDNPFDEVQRPAKGAVAIDMEGAAFYRILEDEKISGLLVKGVCDYADSEKDDSYHQYASEVSAAYILCFIQEYITTELKPGNHDETDCMKLKEQLRVARTTLFELEKQFAAFTWVYAPPPLIHALNSAREEVKHLETEFQERCTERIS